MPRTGTWALWTVVGVLFIVRPPCAGAAPASETLFPDTTKAFLCITDAKTLADQWKKTDLGQLVADPVMKPFIEDLRRQIADRWSSARENLGLTLEELRGVPGGQIAVAAIQPAPGQAAAALVVDITGHQPQTDALLKKLAANLTQQGGKQGQVEIGGLAVTVFDFPVPETQPANTRPRRVVYCTKQAFLVVSDNLDVVRGILGRLDPQGKIGQGKSLASVPAFQAITKRCRTDAQGVVPQICWFIEPIGYIEIGQAIRGVRQRRKSGSLLDSFKKQGFGALAGVGGFVDFGVGKFQWMHRTVVYAPPPYHGAMKSLSFPNGTQFAPPPWIPRDVAAYTTVYANIPNAFDNFGPLFDELYNEGEPGLWDEVLKGLKEDPNGPRIDIRKELVAQLGPRIVILTDYEVPITVTSERLLFAIDTKNEKEMTAALAKLFKNDKEMRRREFAGRVIWESVPAEKAVVPAVSLELPSLGPDGGDAAKSPHEQAILPNQAIAVAYGQLLVASHYDFLTKILKQADQRESLAKSVEFAIIDKTISAISPPARAVEGFSRTDEVIRPTYELIRQGKMPESETMVGRVLNTIFGAGKKGVIRKAEVDGSKLPDYDYVRRYLGPAGVEVTSEPTGWFIKGFLLGKK